MPKISQVSLRVVRGSQVCSRGTARESGLISHRGGVPVGFFEVQWEIWVSLELRQGPQGTFPVAYGKSGLLSTCGGTLKLLSSHCWGIGNHLEMGGNTRWPCPVATGNSVFLWSLNRGVRPCLFLRLGTLVFSRGVKGLSCLLSGSGEDFCFF